MSEQMLNPDSDKTRVAELIDLLRDDTTSPEAKEEIRSWFWSNVSHEAKDTAIEEQFQQMMPNMNPDKEDFRKYAKLAALLDIPNPEIEKPKRKMQPLTRAALRVAAVLIPVAFAIAAAYLWTGDRTGIIGQTQELAEVTVTTEDHGRTVTLPDGSVVELAEGSQLVYDSRDFAANRSVEITGEAVFNIVAAIGADGNRLPFTAIAGDARIRVLGTVFRIAGGREAGSGEVALYEGAVSVTLRNTETVLERGDVFRWDEAAAEEPVVSPIAAEEMAERGFVPTLRFDSSNLANLAAAIEANFGVEFVFGGGVDAAGGKFMADFEGVALEDILTRLTKSNGPFIFALDGQKVYVSKK